jgi:peptidoglycan/LPS O-acetylase OafA/YrhL
MSSLISASDASRPGAEPQQGRRPAGRRPGGKLPYRAGLDGLRALAVTGVFLYHANVSWCPGGFLGVDLFFVLSGFLITSLLLGQWSATGSIDLTQFWLRRARRLFPAVLLVIVFALLATSTIARDDLSRTRADALSALVYLTNWREIIASQSYFNQFGRPSLLQHLWSLAVEEQFYLFWPLILIASLRRFRRGGTIVLTALLAAASVALMWLLYNPQGDPSRVYYGTDTRAFTLLIGALLAFAWPLARLPAKLPQARSRSLDLIGIAALLGVLALFWRAHDYDPWLYHWGFLLMAVVGAILVAIVSHPAADLGRAIGCAPLRWIGARSYGIYLWHWPIMQLTRPGVDLAWHGPTLIVAQAVATVAAAALSYRYVEMPVRDGSAQRRLKAWLDRRTPHQRLGWVLGTAAAIVIVAGLCFGQPGTSADNAFASTGTAAGLSRIPGNGGPLSGGPSGNSSLQGVLSGGSVDTKVIAGSSPGRRNTWRGTGHGGQKTTPAKAPVLPPGPILALGDSVMLGSAPNLEARLGHRLTVDAVVSRQAEATIGRLAEYKADGQLPLTVVVQIGNNGPVWYSDMQNLRRVLAGVPRVVLINVRIARSWEGEVNHELATYVRSWPQAVIANWYGHSTQEMLSDGVHPSVSARPEYARVIVDALKAVEAKSLGTTATGSTKKSATKSTKKSRGARD